MATATLYTSGVLPVKIVMKGTSQITLNDRFSDLTTGNGLATTIGARREPSVARRLDDDDVIDGRVGGGGRGPSRSRSRGPSANQLLSHRMDSRPAVRAALKLRNKSLHQRLGVMARLDFDDSRDEYVKGLAQMKNDVFDRIGEGGGGGRPQQRGGGPVPLNGYTTGNNNYNYNNRNGFYYGGGRRRFYRPYVRNGAFPPRYPRRSYRSSFNNGYGGFAGGFYGNYRFRPRNRWRNRRFSSYNGGGGGGSFGYAGYYRNRSSTNQNQPRLNKDALDQDIDAYMAKTKIQLDNDLDVYMAEVETM